MIDGLLSAVHSLQENQEDHSGSKPGMGSISGHDRSTFSSAILRPHLIHFLLGRGSSGALSRN